LAEPLDVKQPPLRLKATLSPEPDVLLKELRIVEFGFPVVCIWITEIAATCVPDIAGANDLGRVATFCSTPSCRAERSSSGVGLQFYHENSHSTKLDLPLPLGREPPPCGSARSYGLRGRTGQ
jgi:hypothetical protein